MAVLTASLRRSRRPFQRRHEQRLERRRDAIARTPQGELRDLAGQQQRAHLLSAVAQGHGDGALVAFGRRQDDRGPRKRQGGRHALRGLEQALPEVLTTEQVPRHGRRQVALSVRSASHGHDDRPRRRACRRTPSDSSAYAARGRRLRQGREWLR
jgi:hypothetical protein